MTTYRIGRWAYIISIAFMGLIISLLNVTAAHAASITVLSLSPGSSVVVGQTVTFTASASSDLGTTPTFLVFDDRTDTSLTSSAINATSSAFSWTPTSRDLGRHTLSIEATDGKGMIAISTQVITVYATASAASNATSATPAATTAATSTPASSSFIPLGSPVASNSILTTQSTPVTTPTPATVSAVISASAGLSSLQNIATAALLRSYGVSETQINQVLALLAGSTVSAPVASSAASVSSGNYTFTSLLSEGSSGTEVSELQKRLVTLGFLSSAATGHFGPQTTAAVKAFQTAHGIAALGYVGPSTRSALNN